MKLRDLVQVNCETSVLNNLRGLITHIGNDYYEVEIISTGEYCGTRAPFVNHRQYNELTLISSEG